MKKDSKVSKGYAVFFLLLIGVVVWWTFPFPSSHWRYKITVEVDTPEGVKSGSAVREMFFSTEPRIFPEQAGFSFRTEGEAIVVDLGTRGHLFVLFGNELHDAFPNPYYKMGRVEKYWEYMRYYSDLKYGNTAQLLPADKWPQMVMFKNIKDPKSVTLVRGGRFNVQKQDYDSVDDVEELFGTDVKIKQITVEITNESVTWGIDKVLTWLPERKNGSLDGQLLGGGPELSNILHYGNFKTGR